ncbi:MAG: MotA/TolQ/ExbB proton channel family protein [Spirochaetes bacterium]|jgi:biopolymer transport protein ExbB|nr:MotA/TolQ/ExbB proton channel family protein [Spirochaetota bacterium]
MFNNLSVWHWLQMGGFTIWILILCSIVSLAITAEKLHYFRKKSKVPRDEFMKSLAGALAKKDYDAALGVCRSADAPFSDMAADGIAAREGGIDSVTSAMERRILVEVNIMERFTTLLGSIGSTAVYIGLFGTVIGIIRAFGDISNLGSGGINAIIGGIAEALISTAAGIFVAVPAIVVYNLLMKRINNFILDMELCSSEILDIMRGDAR